MIAPDLKDVILIQEIPTGYIVTYKGSQGDSVVTKAFHVSTQNDERLKMVNELILRLGMKYDYIVMDRRTQLGTENVSA